MAIPKIISNLVERYRDNQDGYRRDYGETETRRELLDPFFRTLGWDIDNRQGHAEAYKDVVHEDSVKIGVSTKAPDYSFRVGGVRKFFLEAKRPAVKLKDDAEAAYQLRRYAWSAKLPLSVLSNFGEFAAYDTRIRPSQNDKASTARLMYFTFDDFEKHWDDIAAIFSKDAVYKGSFDKYAAGKGKKGTAEVDDAFLNEIDSWREALAKNIAHRNKDLSPAELNYSVQQTIDRVIFLRICEDRGIESYGRLRQLQNGEHTYARLKQLFQDANDRYNSGLFHFRNETGRSAPDGLTLSLKIDDKVLKDILRHLYYPESPYEFSVLPADILGQVYEQFLGKVIRLTAAGHAKVEDKPEVKKAGGVYYTPTYIVEHIVGNTVGRVLEGLDLDRAAKIRVLDPACGSGSFLIGAYQYLLDWHRNWYETNDPEKYARGRAPRVYRGRGNVWQLASAERKRILLNNIFGVDIDPQAVEVTKLSLLLKVLEEESAETIGRNREMFHERALPDLDINIKCGNSLIASDFYAAQLVPPDPEQSRTINPFDWADAFAPVKKDKGFHVVIGNPPYISALAMSKFQGEEVRDYWKSAYLTARGTYDIYVLFLEKALSLARKEGYVSFITPNKFLSAPYGEALRSFLLKKHCLESLIDFTRVPVFKDASVYPVISVIRPSQKFATEVNVFRGETDGTVSSRKQRVKTADLKRFPEDIWGTMLGSGTELCARIYAQCSILEDIAVVQATSTAAEADEYSKYVSESRRSAKSLKLVNTGTIDRYVSLWGIEDLTNKGQHYKRPVLDIRRVKPDRATLYQTKKIIFAKIAKVIECFLDNEGEYASLNTNCVFAPKEGFTLPFLIGVLNSRLMTFVYVNVFAALKMSGGYSQFQAPQLRLLPIAKPTPDQGRAIERLATQLAQLHTDFHAARTPHEQESVRRRIGSAEQQIDGQVNALYGLTEKDVKQILADET
ncbi:MAG: DNA methyltransferase [Sulfuricaulis sp.]|uniref:Eco57I restriction-modification methylase domain-containing protein n=1 Tax=Sulfuricaulis sp. TaxID=2003553 RepID=UPI0034A3EFD7